MKGIKERACSTTCKSLILLQSNMLHTASLTLLVCLGVQTGHASRIADASDELFSLVRLRREGCLADDFRLPVEGALLIEHCWQQAGHSSTDKRDRRRKAYHCLAEKLHLVEEGQFQDHLVTNYTNLLTNNPNRRLAQQEVVEQCHRLMDNQMQPDQQGVYMLSCLNGMAVMRCQRAKISRLGGEAARTMFDLEEGSCMSGGFDRFINRTWRSCIDHTHIPAHAPSPDKMLAIMLESNVELPHAHRSLLEIFINKVMDRDDCLSRNVDGVLSGPLNPGLQEATQLSPRIRDLAFRIMMEIRQRCEPSVDGITRLFLYCAFEIGPANCVAYDSLKIADPSI